MPYTRRCLDGSGRTLTQQESHDWSRSCGKKCRVACGGVAAVHTVCTVLQHHAMRTWSKLSSKVNASFHAHRTLLHSRCQAVASCCCSCSLLTMVLLDNSRSLMCSFVVCFLLAFHMGLTVKSFARTSKGYARLDTSHNGNSCADE